MNTVRALWAFALLATAFYAQALNVTTPGLLHEERSLYRNILVTERDGMRCMRFVVHDKPAHDQSCFAVADPRRLVFDYTQMLMATLLVKPEPAEILVVGLGGGSLPMALHELLPKARIISAEIDPAVVKAAKRFFNYRENERVLTITQDARVYLKRAVREGRRWDLIILDAFNSDYIPEHLMTREFLEEVKGALKPGGLVAANTFSASRLYHHESVTYEAAFPHVRMLLGQRGNRVLLAAADPFTLPTADEAAARWQARLAPYGVNLRALLAMQSPPNWDRKARVLTDQFSPANLMRR